jgi:hypothetical protein
MTTEGTQMGAMLGADAARMAYEDRHDDYGDAADNLGRIGVVWGELLGWGEIDPDMVALMLAAMKLVRASSRLNRDDLVDGVAYLMLADDIRGKQE